MGSTRHNNALLLVCFRNVSLIVLKFSISPINVDVNPFNSVVLNFLHQLHASVLVVLQCFKDAPLLLCTIV